MQDTKSKSDDVNLELLKAAIKFNAIVFGIVLGTFAALALIIATQISLATWGDNAGTYLSLLGIFLPGYTPTTVGSLIGAFWAFLFGGLSGALTYWLYGRVVGKNIALLVDRLGDTDPVTKPATLRLNGVASGIALGCVIGGALFISTAWIVIRGTAGNSEHAALLSNYLAGYTVSIAGGLIGAVNLFIIVFVSNVMLSTIYNKVVDIRHGKIK